MSSMKKFGIKAMLAGAVLAMAVSSAYAAVNVGGVSYHDTVKVGGKDLQLNGAGVRTKFIVKVFTLGLYLQEKQSNPQDIFKSDTPRRIRLAMLRDVSSEDFGDAFMVGIGQNSTTAEKAKIAHQIGKYGEMFASLEGLKKGDFLDLDYIPGQGTISSINGKRVGETAPTLEFHNAILKIWLGEKPVDAALKPKLLVGNTVKK